jgi:DNA-binding FrmR family transcriptional regulator
MISLKRNAPLKGSSESARIIRCFGFVYGSGRSITASITLKIAVFAPMPRAKVRTTTASQEKCRTFRAKKLDLVNRTKKVIGQLESVLKGLNGDEQCSEILRRLAAARGAINSLMGELMEDHISGADVKLKQNLALAASDCVVR